MSKIALSIITLSLILSACSKPAPQTQSPNGQLGEVGVVASMDPNPPKLTPAEIEDIYRKVGQNLNSPMLQCPEKIWPNYSWKEMNVLLLQENTPSLLWRGETGKLETLAEADVPAGARNGLYSFWPWKSQNAVSVYIGGTNNSYFRDPKRLLGLLIHEGFHYLGQRSWTHELQSRGTVYPIDPTPRLYRRLLKDRLLTYFLSAGNDKKALGQASFWYQKWAKEFPQETKNLTDGHEGTARFVEWLGPIISELGCQASDENILKAAITVLSSPLETYMGAERLALDSEAYPIGGVSALILRLINKDTGWHQSVQQGRTPMEELFKNVAPISDQADPTLIEEYKKSATALNTDLEKMFGDDLRNVLKADFIRVALPSSSIHASYSPKGFYLSENMPEVTIIPLASDFPFDGDTWAFTAKTDANLFSIPSPCPEASYVTLVPVANAISSDNLLEITTPTAAGKIKGS